MMHHQTVLDLHLLGVHNRVIKYFSATGPFRPHHLGDDIEVIYIDFAGGPLVNIADYTQISALEAKSMNCRKLSRLYYTRGQASGDRIMQLLVASAEFHQRIRSWWWYRLGCVPGRVMRAVAYKLRRIRGRLSDHWRSVVYIWACKHDNTKHDNTKHDNTKDD